MCFNLLFLLHNRINTLLVYKKVISRDTTVSICGLYDPEPKLHFREVHLLRNRLRFSPSPPAAFAAEFEHGMEHSIGVGKMQELFYKNVKNLFLVVVLWYF